MVGFSPFEIKDSVGNGVANTGDDVLSLKKGLKRLGLYEPLPRTELNGILDRPLMDGLKHFQEKNGLKVDGLAKPNGPTIIALGRELIGLPKTSQKPLPANPLVARRKKRKLPPRVFSTLPVADKESVLQKAGFDYVPDPIGRLGQGHFEDKDGRKLDHGQKLQLLAEGVKPEEGEEDGKTQPNSEEPKIEWNDIADGTHIPGQKHFEKEIKGPIRVEAVSSTLGLDGVDYRVDWQPLNKHGKVIPEFRLPSDDPNSEFAKEGRRGSHTGIFMSRSQVIKPPYDNPHGFKVRVWIPPQPERNANSAGVHLNIFTAKSRK